MKFITNSKIYKKYNEKYNLDRFMPVFFYLFFGVLTTIINIVVYALFARVFKINYQVSNIIAWLAAVSVAYITNKIYVFKEGAREKKGILYEIFKFLSVRIASLVLDIIIMYVGVRILKIDDVIMKCISNVFVIITNYFMSRYIVFTGKTKEKAEGKKNEGINISFFALLYVTTIAFLADIIIYILKLNYPIAIAVSFLLTTIICVVLKKKRILSLRNDFGKLDLIFLTVIFLFLISSVVFPDNFWDTKSYHIYLQENPFADKINSDFFPGRTLNSFLFPLGDRVHYLFRYLLGYRLGTIMSYYLLVVLFYQIKKFLKDILKNKVNGKVLSIVSMLPVFMFTVIEQVGKYYIDNFSIVFILELIYVIIFGGNILKERRKTYFISLLVGIIVAIKVSNAALLIPLFVYFVIFNIKDIKYLKIYDFMAIIFLLILPFGVYAIDNYIQTGNIVYPYYNSVFKSDYFFDKSWSDTKFGGVTFLEKILWPFYGIISPNRLYDYGGIDPMWYIGYIFTIILVLSRVIKKIIIRLKNKSKKKEKLLERLEIYKENKSYIFDLSVVVLFMYIFWEFMLGGYTRYAFVIPVTVYIIILSVIITNFKSRKKIVIAVLLSISVIFELGYDIYEYFSYYHRSFVTYFVDFGLDGAKFLYSQHAQKIFNDRNENKISLDEGDAFGVIYDDSSIPTMLRENVDVPIYNIRKSFYTSDKYGANDKLKEMYEQKISDRDIWVCLNTSDIDAKMDQINKYGYDIESLKLYTDIDVLNIDEDLYLARILPYSEDENNINFSATFDESHYYKIEKKGKYNVSIAFASNTYINFKDEKNIKVYLVDEKNNLKELLEDFNLNIGDMYTFEVDTSTYSDTSKLLVETSGDRSYRIFIY